MGAPAKFDQLPPELRLWAEAEIERRGFGDYLGIANELTAKIQGRADVPFDSVDDNTVWRRGQMLKRRTERVRASVQAAEHLAAAHPDEQDSLSAATIAMVQSETFDVLLSLQEVDEDTDPADRLKLLASAAKAIAELSHASIRQKEWAGRVRAKLETAKAAASAAAESVARKAGLSDADWGAIRAQILGIEVGA
jgi:hypothetical protein